MRSRSAKARSPTVLESTVLTKTSFLTLLLVNATTVKMSNSLLAGSFMASYMTVPKLVPPIFLAPSLVTASRVPCLQSQFSTSSPIYHRRRKGDNPNRGVSALRRTGLRFAVGMSKYPLPQPVLDPKKRSKIEVDKKHGLWGFFNEKKTLLTEPREEAKFGMYLPYENYGIRETHRVH